jgi:hypothetical protein
MKKSHIPPAQVISPKRRWTLIAVLDDKEDEDTPAVALGRWDRKPVLAMRWNGTNENPIGNPQSRGLPTWFILPNEFRDAILAKMPPEKKAFAEAFFKQEDDNIVAVARRDPATGKTIWRIPRPRPN